MKDEDFEKAKRLKQSIRVNEQHISQLQQFVDQETEVLIIHRQTLGLELPKELLKDADALAKKMISHYKEKKSKRKSDLDKI